MLREILFVGLGGFAGSVLRYLAGKAAVALDFTSYPYATLTVNLVGCLLIGLFWGILDRTRLADFLNPLLVVGFCGGFTTFSSFAGELWRMTDRGAWFPAVAYLTVSVVVGVLLVAAGRYMAGR